MEPFGESDRLLFHSKADFQPWELAFPIAFETGDVSCGGAEQAEKTENGRHEKQEEANQIREAIADGFDLVESFRKPISPNECHQGTGWNG